VSIHVVLFVGSRLKAQSCLQTTLTRSEYSFVELGWGRCAGVVRCACQSASGRLHYVRRRSAKGRGDIEAIGEVALQTLRVRSICATLNKYVVLHQVEKPSSCLIAHLSAGSYAYCASTQADVLEVREIQLCLDLPFDPIRINQVMRSHQKVYALCAKLQEVIGVDVLVGDDPTPAFEAMSVLVFKNTGLLTSVLLNI
jgi:hypothetical protein